MMHSILAVILYLYAFWCVYILVMGLYRVHLQCKLTGLNKILAYPIVIIGMFIDIFANIAIAPFIFLDLPKELLVTTRLIRYRNRDAGWRNKLATYICDNLLDVFDPDGDHC